MEKLAAEEIHVLPWKEEEDRISKLPEEILHQILNFSNTKAAAKTCVLSKAWHYVWCTNPKLKFPDPYFANNFPLDRILQSYHDRNLRLDEFSLLMVLWNNAKAKKEALFLNKWIPVIIQDMRVKTFDLTLANLKATSLELPSLILESDHIQKLSILQGLVGLIKLESSSTAQPHVHLKHLQTLSLDQVYIPQHILDSILSNCLLLERVSLEHCDGFTRIKLFTNNNNQPTNLKAFSFSCSYNIDHDVSIEIGDHIPTLETMELERCLFSVSLNKPLECARLSRLSLTRVKLSSESFSCNLHCLEELKLVECSGIKEFKLSSRSLKRLSINDNRTPFKATIDAPSIVSFHCKGGILPQSISFASTTSDDHLWKSIIYLESSYDDDDDEPSHCFNELYGLLNALSRSKITLKLDQIEIFRFQSQLGRTKHDDIVGVFEEPKHELPVAVENLKIEGSDEIMHLSAAPFLHMFCHMFRPSFVYMDDNHDMLIEAYNEHRKIAELLFKESETGQSYFWPRDLEGDSLQVLYQNQSEWQPVEYTSFTQLWKKGAVRNLELRIQFTWRD